MNSGGHGAGLVFSALECELEGRRIESHQSQSGRPSADWFLVRSGSATEKVWTTQPKLIHFKERVFVDVSLLA